MKITKFMGVSLLSLTMLTSCSSKEVANTPTQNYTFTTPDMEYTYIPPTVQEEVELDGVTTATVLTENTEFGDTTFEIFYETTEDQLLLNHFHSADALVYYALARDYAIDASNALDLIHQAVKESLGSRYEAVRSSFEFIQREDYLQNPEEMSHYGLGFDDLPSSWFDGASDLEINLIYEHLLNYCNINDLLTYHHYSAVDGIDTFFNLFGKLADLDEYLLTQSDAHRQLVENYKLLAFDYSDHLIVNDYIIQLASFLTVRELMDLRLAFLEHFSDEIYYPAHDFTPKRIGYYTADSGYGLTHTEEIRGGEGDLSGLNTYSNWAIHYCGWDGAMDSKTVELYLPKLEAEGILVVMIQEIVMADGRIFCQVKVETLRVPEFDAQKAVSLQLRNEEKLNVMFPSVGELSTEVFDEEESSAEETQIENDIVPEEESSAEETQVENDIVPEEESSAEETQVENDIVPEEESSAEETQQEHDITQDEVTE